MKPAEAGSRKRIFLRHNIAIIGAVNVPVLLILAHDLAVQSAAQSELRQALKTVVQRVDSHAPENLPALTSSVAEELSYSHPSSLKVEGVDLPGDLRLYRATSAPNTWLIGKVDSTIRIYAHAFAPNPATE